VILLTLGIWFNGRKAGDIKEKEIKNKQYYRRQCMNTDDDKGWQAKEPYDWGFGTWTRARILYVVKKKKT
jgi:hypothetical protein